MSRATITLSSEAAIRGHKKRLAQAEKRLGELDRLFIRIYEDNVTGRITDEKFSMMSKTYEDEQAQLKEEIQTLRQEIEVQERQIENLEQFIQRVRKYEDLDELTPYALRELVKAIYIEAPYKSNGKRHQGIRIMVVERFCFIAGGHIKIIFCAYRLNAAGRKILQKSEI